MTRQFDRLAAVRNGEPNYSLIHVMSPLCPRRFLRENERHSNYVGNDYASPFQESNGLFGNVDETLRHRSLAAVYDSLSAHVPIRAHRGMSKGMSAVPPTSWCGQSVERVEDAALLTGRGRFVDDLGVKPGTLHAAILRSPHAHARIAAIRTEAASKSPGRGGCARRSRRHRPVRQPGRRRESADRMLADCR